MGYPTTDTEMPLLLRPEEAARAVALSRSTIYRMIASGELAAVRIGRTLRVPAQALRDWVAQNTSTQTAASKDQTTRRGTVPAQEQAGIVPAHEEAGITPAPEIQKDT
jgi:excisionase family DNA binding protein